MTASPKSAIRKRQTAATVSGVVSAFEDARADYEMSKVSRFIRQRTGLAPQGGTADYHYRSEPAYYRDIEKARDMDRNDAIVGQTIDRAVANEIQDGFTLDTKTGDRKLDRDLWDRFQAWASSPNDCDVAGEFTFSDIERRVSRAAKLDGDIVALGTKNGSLQLIEAHSIQTSTRIDDTFLGVTKNSYGKHLKYWVMRDGITPNDQKEEAEPLDVRDSEGNRQLFHVYNPRRMSQTRGVTALAPIFSVAGMFEDINFAKLVQQQIVSCFAIFRKQPMSPGGAPPSADGGYGLSTSEQTVNGQTRYIEGIAPGMEIIGGPGEELQGFSPDVPNSEFFPHVKLMMQLIGVNLGLPLCLVLMDGSETNFSGWRGAVDEARKGFRINQLNQISRFNTPVYQWKVRQWMAEDAALSNAAKKSKINIFGHKWNAPTWQYIDPVGDAQGDALRIQNALTSPRRMHAERGCDWEEIADEIVDDNAYAIVKAKRTATAINNKLDDGQPVHWRELVSLPMPSGLKMDMKDPAELKSMEQRDREAKQNV